MCLYIGDCLVVLKGFESSMVDLVYLDPPFFSQKNHSLKTRDYEEYSFDDIWESLAEYLHFMKERLIECHRVLKNTGSLFLHCDRNASHYLKIVLDEVFGIENFRSEIIWKYRRWSNSKRGLLNSHQVIYFYSKTKEFKFNTIYTPYSPTTNLDQILQERIRNENGKASYKKDSKGNTVVGKSKKGVPLSDVWEIPYLNPKAKERTGYPTQKPLLLLEQIVKISTDQGDMVLDPFCGSGTTLVAAKLLERQYIGIDIREKSIDLCKKRLEKPIKSDSPLLRNGYSNYIAKSENELAILHSINAIPVQRNSGIDGFLKVDYRGKPVAVKIQKENETIFEAQKKLLDSAKKKGCLLAILIQTRRDLPICKPQVQDNLLLITSYDLLIEEFLRERETRGTSS